MTGKRSVVGRGLQQGQDRGDVTAHGLLTLDEVVQFALDLVESAFLAQHACSDVANVGVEAAEQVVDLVNVGVELANLAFGVGHCQTLQDALNAEEGT